MTDYLQTPREFEAKRPFSPERLTYYAFMHSQGSYFIQLGIFRHVLLSSGIEPNLNPDHKERQRYNRYLTAAQGNESHINPLDPDDVMAMADVVDREFTNIADEISQNANSWELPRPKVARKLGMQLLAKECTILDLENPWANHTNGINSVKRARRLEARVKEGRTSFLHYYGRAENHAGDQSLNEMYADIWGAIQTATGDSGIEGYGSAQELIETHSKRVTAAERHFSAA